MEICEEKKLLKIGNSICITIPNHFLKYIGINPEEVRENSNPFFVSLENCSAGSILAFDVLLIAKIPPEKKR